MKYFLLLAIYFLISPSQKDIYYVAYNKGKVRSGKTRDILKAGDVVSMGDNFIFSDKEDFVSIISPSKGRFLVLPPSMAKPGPKANELVVAVRDNFFPASRVHTMATRGGPISNITDIANYIQSFSDDSVKMLIIDSALIPLNKYSFDDRRNKFFFLRYEFNGEAIKKRIGFKEPANDTESLFLVLNKNIFTVDGKDIAPNMVKDATLSYYNSHDGTSIDLGDLDIRYVTGEKLNPELMVLVSSLNEFYQNQPNKNAQITMEVQEELKQYYGLADKQRLLELIQEVR